MTRPTALFRRLAALSVVAALAVACGGSTPSDDADASSTTAKASTEAIVLGYSAWPGWFVWTVADEAGIFDKAGVKVDLRYFADYIGSLDAMVAGKVDANSQTLNDTLVGVSSGSDQRIVIVNDNSAGNDAIIVDESIKTVADLKGKTVAAEPGVVDHFLLLQGLDEAGMTEADIDFRGLPTADAAAAFAGGQFDAVGVFAPFTIEALKRPGSRVLFSSKDYPGTIPDHLVVSGELVDDRPTDVQKLVNAWYLTLEWIDENPEKANEIMAEQAELSPEAYADLADGTKLFTAAEALAAFEGKTAPTGLTPMAEKINTFLVDTELAKKPAPLDDLFEPSFTQAWLDDNRE